MMYTPLLWWLDHEYRTEIRELPFRLVSYVFDVNYVLKNVSLNVPLLFSVILLPESNSTCLDSLDDNKNTISAKEEWGQETNINSITQSNQFKIIPWK